MFDKIIYIGDRTCNVKLKDGTSPTFNLMNLHVVFEDSVKKILGEVDDIEKDIVKIRFLGEITERGLLGGVIQKPTLDAHIRVIEKDEIPLVTGKHTRGYMLLGKSPFYSGKKVFICFKIKNCFPINQTFFYLIHQVNIIMHLEIFHQ